MNKKNTSAFDIALHYISYRNRTEKEVEEYLIKKGFSETEVMETIEKLHYYHYLNDVAYVKQKIQNNMIGNQFGRNRLKQDLKKHGITEHELEILEVFFTASMEEKCLVNQIEKAKEKYANETGIKKNQKIRDYLLRRGFSLDGLNIFQSDYLTYEEKSRMSKEPNQDGLERLFFKYYRMQRNKGFEGETLKKRIFKNLAAKGYRYDDIKRIVNEHEEEFEEE